MTFFHGSGFLADPDPDPIKKSDPVASLASPVEYAIFEQVDRLG